MIPGTNIATEYAQIYKIEPQKDGESDADFRGRVAGIIRHKGDIIEAHEALNNERYETSPNVMTGIFGAVAMVQQNVDYGSKGERKLDDEFAAGVIVQAPKNDDATMALIALLLFGGDR